jgi:hypothetical protein|tara:strand:+ start:2276 stop:2416 length:141 start_codon:yes stop_codon:yes gene_type:complete
MEEEENDTGSGFLDINDPNTFLGGQNVHNLIIIGLLVFIIVKNRQG